MSAENEEELSGHYEKFKEFRFTLVDYCTFCFMTLLSTAIGFYFGYFKKTRTDDHAEAENVQANVGDTFKPKYNNFGSKKMNEYLLGSRKLKPFPVAMSLVGSYVSGVTILGTPSEVYNYGTQYWLTLVSIILMGIVVSSIYLPVFFANRIGSSFEYLELRFNSMVRRFLSIVFLIDDILYLPFLVYVPALALNQVTGLNLYMISSVICIICVFYTLIGGIKVVVHTDAFQVLMMFIAVVVVAIFGTVHAGGPSNVFKNAKEGGRIIFSNFEPSPYARYTFWSVIIGGFCHWTSINSVNQVFVQRYLSLPTLKKSRQSIVIYIVAIVPFVLLCCYTGLLIFNFYRNCDPRTANLITNDDQLLPIYVMQTAGYLKGISGLFIAGVFGAALSSLSVGLNSVALVVLEDVARSWFRCDLSERGASHLVKGCIGLVGLIGFLLVFVLEKMEGVLMVAIAVAGVAASTTFAIFTMGMLMPWTNSVGVLIGGVTNIFISSWIAIGSQWMGYVGKLKSQRLDVSVSECMSNHTIINPAADDSDVLPLYRLSFLWLNLFGILTTITIAAMASFLTGANKVSNLDGNLLSPIIHRFLPKECFPETRNHIMNGVDKPIELIKLVKTKSNKNKRTF